MLIDVDDVTRPAHHSFYVITFTGTPAGSSPNEPKGCATCNGYPADGWNHGHIALVSLEKLCSSNQPTGSPATTTYYRVCVRRRWLFEFGST
eukprot:scaffold39100_cov129-Skeletonema_marinoi.AAC.6